MAHSMPLGGHPPHQFKKGARGRTAADNRLFFDAILWLARTALHWRDLPPELGNWRTAHCRFRFWKHAGVWESLLNASNKEPDFEHVLVDATICKAHADASSTKAGLRAKPPGALASG